MWIKCSDRLPEVGDRVLCYTLSEMCVIYNWADDDDEIVTHWQPLPSPPEDV